MAEYREERVFLGEALGEMTLRQMCAEEWHQATLSCQSLATDATGLRVYGGCHVLSRFLGAHSAVLADKGVCELGCGTGVGSIVASRFCRQVVATDGDDRAVQVCSQNLHSNGCKNARATQLRWSKAAAQQLLDEEAAAGAGRGFDVVIASDVMYYNVEVSELMATVKTLLEGSANGEVETPKVSIGDEPSKQIKLFIHAHLFRVNGQLEQVLDFCQQYGWNLYTIKLADFLPAEELRRHVDWMRVKCLVCGPKAQMWEQCCFFDLLTEITAETVDQSDDEDGTDDEDAAEPDDEMQAELARIQELLLSHGVVY